MRKKSKQEIFGKLSILALLVISILTPADLLAQTQPEVFDVNIYEGIYADLLNASDTPESDSYIAAVAQPNCAAAAKALLPPPKFPRPPPPGRGSGASASASNAFSSMRVP